MNMQLKISTTAVALLSAAYISAATADDDTGFFIGAGLSRADVSANQFDESENEPAVKLGYMFNDNYGIELDAIDIGSKTTNDREADVGILALSFVGSYAIADQLDVYGKLGAAEVALTLTDNETDITDDKETEFFWAVGSEYDFGAFNVYLEYNRFDGPQSSNVNVLVLGAKYEF